MKEKVQEEAEVVCIGAGLTGLLYGLSCLKQGYDVALLERHIKPGGYATNFIRDERWTFDCSLHKITGLGPHGNLRIALQDLGIWEELKFEMYEELSCISIGDQNYKLPVGYDALKKYFFETFPTEQDGLKVLFTDIETHGHQNYMFARMALGEYELNRDLLEGSRALAKIRALEYFRGLFSNEHLIIILSALATNLGAFAEEIDALYFLHFAYTFFSTGAGYVRGSSQALSDKLRDLFVQRGGRIYLKEQVMAIDAQAGQITGVETRRRYFKTNDVVATCSPHAVYNLLPSDALGPAFQRKLDALEYGLGAFSVYLGLDCSPEEAGLKRSEYLLAADLARPLTDVEKRSDDRYQLYPMAVTNYHKLDPTLGNVLVAIVCDSGEGWFELDRMAYKKRKAEVAQLVLDRLLRTFPDLAKHIVYQEASTPRTNFRYTLSPGGSAFGYKAKPGRNLRFLQKPRVSGLRFVGTWVSGAGYEPAMCLGYTHGKLRPAKAQISKTNHLARTSASMGLQPLTP